MASKLFSSIHSASELIERIGYDECRPFIDYALAAAKTTKFQMKTLRGTQQYLVTWEANKEQRENARTKEQERATEARNKALKDTYDTMARRRAVSYLESLSPDARAAITTEAKERVLQKTSNRIGLGTFIERKPVKYLCKLLFDRIFSRHAVEPPRGSSGW